MLKSSDFIHNMSKEWVHVTSDMLAETPALAHSCWLRLGQDVSQPVEQPGRRHRHQHRHKNRHQQEPEQRQHQLEHRVQGARVVGHVAADVGVVVDRLRTPAGGVIERRHVEGGGAECGLEVAC